MPWLNITDAARHLGIARSTLRDRISRDPERNRTDAAGRLWLAESPERVPEYPDRVSPAPVAGVTDTPRIDALNGARPVRASETFPVQDRNPAQGKTFLPAPPPVSSAPEKQRIPLASGGVTKWIAIPDVHVPYHDPKIIGIILRAADAIGATRCVQLGDLTDCYSVSRFPKSRDRRLDIAWELDSTAELVNVLDKAFPDERVITLGNHDVRMERYVAEKAPEIAALFPTYVERIGFKERGWRVTNYMDGTRIGDLNVTHEVGFSGAHAAQQTLGVYSSSVIFGHTHRIGFAVAGDLDGKRRVGAMLGWCGDVEKIDYHYRARVARESSHGFGIVYVEDDGRSTVVPVVISEGRCVVEGKVIR